ncbi:MAG: Ca-activated chloride channel family protein [Myxococcota bacterium]|jgi:Ca-activated chloride channel family protein
MRPNRPTLIAKLAGFTCLIAMSLAPTVYARSVAPGPDADKTMSPYFIVKGAQPGTDTMPLKDTRADVSISGTIAHVKVTQTYANTGKDTLEAIYVFPGSTKSAVFGMRMKVGDRTIIAEIQRKEEARKMYEAAKAAGKSASLLEQHRPNVFQMNVANILPGDTIVVEMDYTELLVPTNGVYEFVYPAVVGPRYTGEAAENGTTENWTATPHTKEGVAASYGWDLDIQIAAGMPIKRISSSSHPITTNLFTRPGAAHVTLGDDIKDADAGSKDFVLQFALAGNVIQSGLMLFEGEKENFFLAMVQPPKTVAKKTIPKREYIFIMDVSGSMRGFPLDTAKQVMRNLFKGLNKDDLFNILYFSGSASLMSPESLPATSENLDRAESLLTAARGGGGTRILNALDRALALPTAKEFSRTFVVVTDGYVSVEPAVFEKIKANLGQANLFSFGIGKSVNRFIIDGMARAGLGEPFYVMHDDDAAEKAAKFSKYIDAPALTNIAVQFDGFDVYDVEPTQVPDLFASRPVMIFGKYRGEAKGSIKVTGLTGEGDFSKTLAVNDYFADEKNEALRYLWARHRIAELSDMNQLRKDDKRIEQVTQLGLDYNLMTAYTSFIAVDERVRNQGGKNTTVKQPLPLPDGVSNSAVASPPRVAMPMAMAPGSSSGGMGFSGRGLGGGGASRKHVRRPSKPRPSPAVAEPSPTLTPTEESRDEDSKPETVTKAKAMVVRVLQATGGLNANVIRNVIQRHLGRMAQRCGAGVSGAIDIKLIIGEDGIVTSATGTAGDAAAIRCLVKEVRRFRFSSAVGKGATTATVRFQL